MGVVYHSNYVLYFEVGRTEFMRRHGVCYADMESAGMILAVIDMSARFFRPARYDELLIVETRLAEASGVRVRFEYRVLRSGPASGPEEPEELLCAGSTTLACVNDEGRPARIRSPWKEQIESAVSAPSVLPE